MKLACMRAACALSIVRVGFVLKRCLARRAELARAFPSRGIEVLVGSRRLDFLQTKARGLALALG